MADIAHLYPPSPTNVPADLTTPPKSYRSRVLVVLASLFVFLFVYLALTVGTAFTSYWCFATLMEPDPPTAPVYVPIATRGRTPRRRRRRNPRGASAINTRSGSSSAASLPP